MRYFLSSNFKTLRRNPGTYLPTTLFLMVGMTVLFVILCGTFSFFDDLRERTKNVEGMDISIIHDWYLYHERIPPDEQRAYRFTPVEKNRFIPDEDAVLMPSDLTLIEEGLGSKVSFKASYLSMGAVKPEEERYAYQIAYLSDDYFNPFREQVQGDVIMGSRRLLEFVANACTPDHPYYGWLRHFPLLYDTERGVFTDLDGKGEIQLLFFEDTEGLESFDLTPFLSETATGEANEPRWEEYLFVPLKYYFDIYYPGDNENIVLRASSGDFENLYEVLTILNTNHKGKMTYLFDETSSVFLRGVREQTELIAMAAPVTLILLLVVGINFMGLQLMSVRRRRRDLAIQMTCGARRGHILGGVLFLTLLTVTAAAILAVGLGAIIVQLLEIRLYNVFVTVKWISLLPVLGLGWLIGGLACAPSLVRLFKLSPVETLTEQ